jgi:hypothetical protein
MTAVGWMKPKATAADTAGLFLLNSVKTCLTDKRCDAGTLIAQYLSMTVFRQFFGGLMRYLWRLLH